MELIKLKKNLYKGSESHDEFLRIKGRFLHDKKYFNAGIIGYSKFSKTIGRTIDECIFFVNKLLDEDFRDG